VGLLPFIVWDLRQGVYLQTLGFLGWVFTKIIEGVAGIFVGGRDALIFKPSFEFVRNFISPPLGNYALVLFLLALLYFLRRMGKRLGKKEFPDRLIFVWFFVTIVGFFVRGTFSGAYMPLLYVPLLVIFSLFFDFLVSKFKTLGWVLLLVLVMININLLLETNFSLNSDEHLTLTQRLSAAKLIVDDAEDVDFSLDYRGPSYEFPVGDNHWRYLLWWFGNEPVEKTQLKYAIFEKPYKAIEGYEIIGNFESVKIGRK
jgi:hypothetical protein